MAATYTSTLVATVSGSLVPTTTETIVAPLAAPSGYVVDFDHPERKGDVDGYWVHAFGIIFALGFLAMRVYVKTRITPPLNWEDVMWARKVQGLHAWEMDVHRFSLYNVLVIVGPALFALCQFFAKFSILLFYLRLAPIRWFRLSTYLLMALFTIYTIGIIALMVFPCTPVAKSWDYNITHGHCINRTGIFMATALVNIAGEVATLLVPMPVLMSLQMPTMQKVGLFCMFAVGMLTCITSIIRLVVLFPLLAYPDRDRPWSYSIASVWIVAEANLVTVCGCLPVAKKFLRHVAPRLIGESATSSHCLGRDEESTQLRTIGAIRTRGKRTQDYALEVEDESENGDEEAGRSKRSLGEEDGRRTEAWSDGGSETAIIVKKTMVIEYTDERDDNAAAGSAMRRSHQGVPMGLPGEAR
ncbi:hypothetical protein SLS57_011544 [Botryosphaeria dothidea]